MSYRSLSGKASRDESPDANVDLVDSLSLELRLSLCPSHASQKTDPMDLTGYLRLEWAAQLEILCWPKIMRKSPPQPSHMPSHTPASALIKLFSIDGAPWGWQTWKDRTGIRRGLFPPDDDFLPPGMTRQDTIDVQLYFKAYQDLKTEDDKITFATKTRGAPAYPGRATWNLFIQKNWNRWGVQWLKKLSQCFEVLHYLYYSSTSFTYMIM
ncbi:hypothetical protein AGABI1DRAFT_125789 [Agaricus bisporus var. burnettii JB137-S8]|uniref:Uncharacterized protein n=1 Tax=Agaricus bisporus var. burnettii (strain JB137-S8 / ATCC MYA-4627 / FGSC 10392) TaxID=597362 RepID=K5W3M6_AGABU|nr:uncharacterized protein AGABI1DRAFT_125789 [Agaricus bisporus var. burnettii JB137-S8]EKM81399.1 hypothetical protein AGABI1DRAFT_125789 [Agaricus bisporus var. burnettii JB137-S8]